MENKIIFSKGNLMICLWDPKSRDIEQHLERLNPMLKLKEALKIENGEKYICK